MITLEQVHRFKAVIRVMAGTSVRAVPLQRSLCFLLFLVYTFFALCEYLVVISNIAFHMTVYLDFGSTAVMVAVPVESKHI